MIKLEKTEVFGWEAAIRGMRNPMNSWYKSDSGYGCDRCKNHKENPIHKRGLCRNCDMPIEADCYESKNNEYIIGPNDHDLMMRLRNAGTDHRKFMRMITVYVDITAPLYWWKEFDTYKVGTVANSCSTMHKIHAKEFTLEDFSCEHLINDIEESHAYYSNVLEIYNYKTVLLAIIGALNNARAWYLETKDKKYWWQMIQLLPSSYNQKRTVMLNYEVLANIYKSRKGHKLDEWREFCKWIKSLPYSELITGPSLNDYPICNEIMEEAKKRVKEGE